MRRWLAHTGSPVLLTDVLYTPVHSLIDPSLHSKLGPRRPMGGSALAGMMPRWPRSLPQHRADVEWVGCRTEVVNLGATSDADTYGPTSAYSAISDSRCSR